MADRSIRVAFVLTHPVQYMSPWFRAMHASACELTVRVLYAVQPTPAAQAAGFGGRFTWDRPMLDGYDNRILEPGFSEAALGADTFAAVDSRNLESAIADFSPDVAVVPGWHAALYLRAMTVCHRRGIPVLYRGDTNLHSGPRGWRRPLWRARSRQRLARYDGFLSVGVRSREYLLACGAPEPLVIDSPHAVDNEFFGQAAAWRQPDHRAALRASFGLRADAFVVLFAGKLIDKKHPLDAIRAVARLDGGSQLLVAGSGPLAAACRESAARERCDAHFADFVNQSELLKAYAAADCLVLPSDGRETWGLVVNEAMASGMPAVVSDRVGCQPDLVRDGLTGAVAPFGDVVALAEALGRVRDHRAPDELGARCQEHIARYSYDAATRGLVTAATRLVRMRTGAAPAPVRVIACCTNMVIAGGLERMTFEVLRTLAAHGADVRCTVNAWDSSRIVRLAEHAGVGWSVGYYWHPISWLRMSPRHTLRQAWEMLRSSASLLALAGRVRPTHLLAPDFVIPIRHAPALMLLRLFGCRVVLRVGMAPEPGPRFARVWRHVVSRLVDRVVCNSEFIRREVLACGVPPAQVVLIRNTVARRPMPTAARRDPLRVLYVGQIIPGKGVDLLIEALDELHRKGLAATLDIVGDIDGWESPSYAGYRASVLARARDVASRAAIRFLGVREDVPQLMASAAVHCLPSRLEIREGMAGVVLEAKAAGTPSVVTTSGSLPELVTHGRDGWVVEPEVHALAEALGTALGDPERRARAGDAARASLSQFTREAFERSWLAEFDLVRAHASDRERQHSPGMSGVELR
jgi:glycosyltransferase involved in cell wall biosynthesis